MIKFYTDYQIISCVKQLVQMRILIDTMPYIPYLVMI